MTRESRSRKECSEVKFSGHVLVMILIISENEINLDPQIVGK
jgi:hypothetical protein